MKALFEVADDVPDGPYADNHRRRKERNAAHLQHFQVQKVGRLKPASPGQQPPPRPQSAHANGVCIAFADWADCRSLDNSVSAAALWTHPSLSQHPGEALRYCLGSVVLVHF